MCESSDHVFVSNDLFGSCYLYLVFKTVFIFNRDIHDPQRPHLDKGYTVQEYMKLTMDMMAKMKEHRTVTGSPNVTQITTGLLFRYKSHLHIVLFYLLLYVACSSKVI